MDPEGTDEIMKYVGVLHDGCDNSMGFKSNMNIFILNFIGSIKY